MPQFSNGSFFLQSQWFRECGGVIFNSPLHYRVDFCGLIFVGQSPIWHKLSFPSSEGRLKKLMLRFILFSKWLKAEINFSTQILKFSAFLPSISFLLCSFFLSRLWTHLGRFLKYLCWLLGYFQWILFLALFDNVNFHQMVWNFHLQIFSGSFSPPLLFSVLTLPYLAILWFPPSTHPGP